MVYQGFNNSSGTSNDNIITTEKSYFLSALHELFHLILMATHWSRYYYSYFTKRNLWLRKSKCCTCGHTASKWQSSVIPLETKSNTLHNQFIQWVIYGHIGTQYCLWWRFKLHSSHYLKKTNKSSVMAEKPNDENWYIPDTWSGSILLTTNLSSGMGWSRTVHEPPSFITVCNSRVSEGHIKPVSEPPSFWKWRGK